MAPREQTPSTSGMTSGASHEQRLAAMRQRDDRPNILILLTDQQRADTIRASGAHWMHTPNLDRLATDGSLFTHAYSPNPICMPARHNMLTGLPARFHGYADNVFSHVLPPALPTFPRLLSDSGYETRSIGKNHFHPVRRHHGYLNLECMEEVPGFREEDEYLMYLKRVGLGHIQNIHGVRNLLYMLPQRALMPEKHHGTAWVANRAIEFAQNNRGRHPWLLTLGWIAPHPPFNVPDEFADLYTNADLPSPHVSETPISPLAEENRILGNLPNERYVRRMREAYYAAVSHIDHHIGRILQCLEETGQIDNTLIIFTSDHGEMLGDHGTYQKWLPYDSCARIPLILHWPRRVRAGVRRDEFVDLNDVLPTVLDAAGIAPPTDYHYPGASLLHGEVARDRTHQYMEYSTGSRRWISLRDRRNKYNYYYGADEELFDLETDPHETRNLLAGGSSAHEAVRAKLRRRLLEYEQTWGLPGGVKNGDFVRRDRFQAAGARNRAFPIFREKLTDPEERAAMQSFLDEVAQAIAREPVLNLEDLDLSAWQRNGSFTDTQIRQLLDDVRYRRSLAVRPDGDAQAAGPLPA